MKEKIILGNKVELPYDSIGFGAGTLVIFRCLRNEPGSCALQAC